MQGRISKHLSLACEAGAKYRLLLKGVSPKELAIQEDLLSAAYVQDSLHPKAFQRVQEAIKGKELSAVNASTALHLLAQAHQGERQRVADLVMAVVAGHAEARDLAITSWAMARLSAQEEQALQALTAAIQAALNEAPMEGHEKSEHVEGLLEEVFRAGSNCVPGSHLYTMSE